MLKSCVAITTRVPIYLLSSSFPHFHPGLFNFALSGSSGWLQWMRKWFKTRLEKNWATTPQSKTVLYKRQSPWLGQAPTPALPNSALVLVSFIYPPKSPFVPSPCIGQCWGHSCDQDTPGPALMGLPVLWRRQTCPQTDTTQSGQSWDGGSTGGCRSPEGVIWPSRGSGRASWERECWSWDLKEQ